MIKTLLGGLAALLFMAGAGQASVLYGTNGSGGNPSDLAIIDQTTGAVSSTVGAIVDASGNGIGITGLAFNPIDGLLYGSQARAGAASDPGLYLIDVNTALATRIGSFNLNTNTAADISFGADGTLYGFIEPGDDDLATINTSTGQATIVGDAGISVGLSGLVVLNATTAIYLGIGTMLDIDPGTGASSNSRPTSVTSVGLGVDIDPDSGVIFAIESLGSGAGGARNLVTVALDGTVSTIGATLVGLDALAFAREPNGGGDVPEPATLALLGLGLAGLGLMRRRHSA